MSESAHARVLLPTALLLCAIGGWEAAVRLTHTPHYILPAPSLIATTLVQNFDSLAGSWLFTLEIAFGALLLVVIGGVLSAALFALCRPIELALFPFAVLLQVTPIVAITPLLLIYVQSTTATLLICAWMVAFFPILSNTVLGLRSADPNLQDLFSLYRASASQRLRWLLIPTALPYFLGGLRISGGLALIGAVVAEFTAGAAGRETGLASRILEASFRSDMPRMYAALTLILLTGVAIFALFSGLSRLLLGRWHASLRRG
ncbi:MAG: ABC transporter permease [Gammaproteobacteria bacterium]|nr:ABC transporter permease [Gammaproteobacteria bacterium]